MAVDFVVKLECDAKRALGGGDTGKGTLDIVRRLKARNQAKAIEQVAEEEGSDPKSLSVTIAVTRDGETEEREVSYDELLAEAAPLQAHAAGCADCPANVLGENHPYGCVGSVGYPISPDAERWLMERVAGASKEAHEIMLSAIDDFGYDGEPVQEMRERGMLEGEAAVEVELGVDSDQVLQALLFVGSELEPSHCHLLLVWLGALTLSDTKGEDLELGDTPDDVSAFELYVLFAAMGAAVENGVGFLIDA